MSDIFEDLMAGHDERVTEKNGHVTYYPNLLQGSDDWFAARLGILTASEMKHCLTPTLKAANNDKTRAHVWEIAAQRISQYIEPTYQSDDMLRGHIEEEEARKLYAKHFADQGKVRTVGFVTNNRLGFPIGYSPDWLVGEDGQAECKSRNQKYQVQTVCEHMADLNAGTIPAEYLVQVQTGLMVTERKWCDFISYSNGLPMATIRVYPDPEIFAAIEEAANTFEQNVTQKVAEYERAVRAAGRYLIPTERKDYEEMYT